MRNIFFNIAVTAMFIAPFSCLFGMDFEEEERIDYNKTLLYSCNSDKRPLLYIPSSKCASLDELKKRFHENNLVTGGRLSLRSEWDENDWNKVYQKITSSEKNIDKNHIELDDVAKLIVDAKAILNKFIPSQPLNEQSFVFKRDAVRRFFVYEKLRDVINRKNLSHIHLPKKYLVLVKGNIYSKAFSYIFDQEEINNFLDQRLEIFVRCNLGICCDVDAEGYEICVFAERKENKEVNFSAETLEELKILINEAPFDVGYDNIFTDEKGDAIIIDTEYKGEGAKSSILKLQQRYTKDLSVRDKKDLSVRARVSRCISSLYGFVSRYKYPLGTAVLIALTFVKK